MTMLSSFTRSLITLFFTLMMMQGVKAQYLYPSLGKSVVDLKFKQLNASRNDSSRVRLLVTLSRHYYPRWDGSEGSDQYLDSAYFFAEKAVSLSKLLKDLKGEAQSTTMFALLTAAKGDVAKGEKAVLKAINLCQNQHFKYEEGEAWYYRGEIYENKADQLEKKGICFKKSYDLFRSVNAGREAAFVLKSVADIHLQQGHLQLAVNELHQVLNIYRKVKYPNTQYTYDLLSGVYRNMGNYEQALRYCLFSIDVATKNNDQEYLGDFYLKLAAINQDMNRYPESRKNLNTALKFAIKLKHEGMLLSIATRILGTYFAENHPKEGLINYQQTLKANHIHPDPDNLDHLKNLSSCYLQLHDYGKAQPYIYKIIELEEARNANDAHTAVNFATASQYFLKVGKFDQARHYLNKALVINQQSGTLKFTAILNYMLFQADSAQGKLSEAIKRYQLVKRQNDSVFNETKDKQFSALQVQYDTHKKEQNIALLTKQNQLQQAKIKERETQRNLFIGGLLLLIMISVLIYQQSRNNQRKNKQLQAQQEEISNKNQVLQQLVQEKEWLLREVHHRVKNNLHTITSLLESQTHFLEDSALEAVKNSQHRIYAMSLIHQKLYQADDVSTIDMAIFIADLVSYLKDSFDAPSSIRFQANLDKISMDVSQAIPVGLILNEAVTNALKYAFPKTHAGTINIVLKESSEGMISLEISDNGVGLPENFQSNHSGSLGLKLMEGLSRDLHAAYSLESYNGTRVLISFQKFTPMG